MKPGLKTTEFWASLLGTIFTSFQAQRMSPVNVEDIVIQGLMVVAPLIAYIISRGLAKLGK